MNTSWVLGEKILRIISALFIGVWVTNYLGAEDFGIFSYAQSLVGILTAFSTLGISSILTRELVNSPEKHNELVGTSFILQTIGSILLIILLIVGLQFSSSDSSTKKIAIVLATATFFQSFGVIVQYFQSIVKSKFIVIASISSLVLSSIAKVTLILIKAELMAFVYVLVFDNLILALGYLYFYKKNNLTFLNWSFNLSRAKNLLKDSWPLILSSIVISIYMKIDQIMIKEMIGNIANGQYAAAVRLSEAWYFIPVVISSSLFPAIINAKKISEEFYYKRLQRFFDLMFGIALFIAIPMTFLSDWLIQLLYSSEYSLSANVLSIHIWTGIFVFLGMARSGWIINENLQRYQTLYLTIGMISNVGLNYFLIPKYGIEGAAYASLAAQAISVLIAPVFFKPTRITFSMMMKSFFFVFLFKSESTSNE